MTIMLDVMGPLVASESTQPQVLLDHLVKTCSIETSPVSSTASEPRPRYEGQGGIYAIKLEIAQGWTWTSDPLLDTRETQVTQPVSEGYAKAFMGRTRCPVLVILASNNLDHAFRIERAPLISCMICDWILDLDRLGQGKGQ